MTRARCSGGFGPPRGVGAGTNGFTAGATAVGLQSAYGFQHGVLHLFKNTRQQPSFCCTWNARLPSRRLAASKAKTHNLRILGRI